MRSIAAGGWLALTLACSFDSSGVGENTAVGADTTGVGTTSTDGTSGAPPDPTSSTGAPDPGTDSGSGTGEPTTGAVDPSSGEPPEPPATSSGPGTTSGTTSGTSTGDDTSTSEPPDETTGPAPCNGVGKHLMIAADATVAAPMGKFMSSQAGIGTVVISKVKDEGTADFAVDLQCGGEVAIWVRVFDPYPGLYNDDPDSFYLRIDGGEEYTWFYGCQTADLDSTYHWLRLDTNMLGKQCNEAMTVQPSLSAGQHNFMFRNREAANGNAVAAISRVLITDDLGFVPEGDGT